jgi:hypothetical protein
MKVQRKALLFLVMVVLAFSIGRQSGKPKPDHLLTFYINARDRRVVDIVNHSGCAISNFTAQITPGESHSQWQMSFTIIRP